MLETAGKIGMHCQRRRGKFEVFSIKYKSRSAENRLASRRSSNCPPRSQGLRAYVRLNFIPTSVRLADMGGLPHRSTDS